MRRRSTYRAARKFEAKANGMRWQDVPFRNVKINKLGVARLKMAHDREGTYGSKP